MAGTIKHEWIGTTLIITSDSGTSACDLKGEKGDMGIRGAQGAQGEPYAALALYPVGAIYISADSTSPAQLFGGSWVTIEDRFLLAASDNYPVDEAMGATTHKHASGELHSAIEVVQAGSNQVLIDYIPHSMSDYYYDNNYSYYITGSSVSYSWDMGHSYADGVAVFGNTESASNMPPYLSVYMWKRVA